MLTPIADTLDLAMDYARAACRVRELEEAADDLTRDEFAPLRAMPAPLIKALMEARKALVTAHRRLDPRIPADGFDLGAGARIVRA